MTVQFDIGDRAYQVDVARDGTTHRVWVDGRLHVVEAVRVGSSGTWSLIIHDENGAARSVEAFVSPGAGNGTVHVSVEGHGLPVEVRAGLGRRTRDAASARGTGLQRVMAPMPGRIVRVLVKPGDAVVARQGLVVVEAMKMENELRASRAGLVREVFVTEGQSVEAGTALAVVE
jgi:biotin carboxyl carrier protein